jgi:DNA primase
MDPVSEIKARLSIEELVSQYCHLQKAGRHFKALCPFHHDTHPSLLISPDKGIAYCFACQTGGDIFSFYQAIEHVDFSEALRDLAEKAGVTLPHRATAGPKQEEKQRLRSCLEEALGFYQKSLKESREAQEILQARAVPAEIVERFQIGYAPNSFDALYTHLLRRGFSRREILGAGLGIQRELEEGHTYDRFRNRIIFPISDHQGHLVGFGGRTIGDDDAKYINSPDGPLYSKSSALFGLSHAKEAVRERRCVILVEGYFDVLACHRLGITHVVAVSGTALTEQHVRILHRCAEKLILCLDQDPAGKQAAERAFVLAAPQGFSISSLQLPAGKDPDECSRLQPEALVRACEEGGHPYLEGVLEELQEQHLEKRSMLRRLLPLLQSLPSAVEREEAVARVASLLGATVTALEDDLQRERAPQSLSGKGEERRAHAPFTSFEIFCGLLLLYPAFLSLLERIIEPEEEGEQELYSYMKILYNTKGTIPPVPLGRGSETVPPVLSEEKCRERVAVLQLYCEEHFGTWSDAQAEKELRKLSVAVNRAALLKKQQQLISRIRQAHSLGKKVEEEKLLTQYQQVLKLQSLAS